MPGYDRPQPFQQPHNGLTNEDPQPNRRVDSAYIRHHRPIQPPFRRQDQRFRPPPPPVPYHQAALNKVPVGPPQTLQSQALSPFNKILSFVGLEALPFVKRNKSPPLVQSESAGFQPEEAEATYNSLDADYYADYEGGAFFR